jgi:hypothetical protein
MTPVSLTCPYCNSLVVLPRLPEGDQRIRCPRCQEVFPYHGQPGVEATGEARSGGPSQAMLAPPGAAAVSSGRRLSNRALARIVVAVMAVMAAVAFLFAWKTTDERRQHDGQKAEEEPEPVPVVAPGKLAGLGYLPADVSWLAGIHVGELWDQRQTMRPMLLHLTRYPALRLQDLEHSTGLKIKDVDHIVVGVRLAIFPVVVVRTRKPYNAESVLNALNTGREKANIERKGVYQFPLKEFQSFMGTVWCADEQTLVFAMLGHDIESLPTAADPSNSRFATPIQQMLNKRAPGTQVWGIGEIEQLQTLRSLSEKWPAAAALASQLSQVDLGPLSNVRWLSAWTQFSADKVACQADAECKDLTAVKKLKDVLAERGVEDQKKLPFMEGNDRFRHFLEDLQRSLKIEQNDTLLTLKAEARIESIKSALAPKSLKSRTRSGYSAQ